MDSCRVDTGPENWLIIILESVNSSTAPPVEDSSSPKLTSCALEQAPPSPAVNAPPTPGEEVEFDGTVFVSAIDLRFSPPLSARASAVAAPAMSITDSASRPAASASVPTTAPTAKAPNKPAAPTVTLLMRFSPFDGGGYLPLLQT